MESDDAPIVLEETLTGHCESCLSNTELPQLLHVCHELLDGQTKIRHQLSDVSLNLGILSVQLPKRNSVGLLPCHAKEQTPVSSKSLSSFRQIDACVDGSILRRGMTRKIMESASASVKAPRRKSLVVPEGSPEAFSDISKAKVLSTEQEMSMSALFRDRETQLMPKTKTLTSNTKESPTMLTTTEGKEALMEDTWCSRCARRMSTSYRWFMILLNASTVCLIIFGCIAAPNAPSECEQEALMEYLENFMDITGLSMRWKQRQGRNALTLGRATSTEVQTGNCWIAILLWLVVVGVKTWLMLDECSLSQVKVIEIVGYAIATACLSAMCYLQLTSWHGITMKGPGELRVKAVSLMRVTSRVYQRSFAVLLMTTLLVFFGALIDIGQGEVLPTLPSLVLAVALMSSSFMAASATAHCALEADQVPGSHHW
eukprot:g13856.t3